MGKQRAKVRRGKRSSDGAAGERSLVNQTVSKEVQRHGQYEAVPFKLVEVTEGGKRIEKEIKVVRNKGGTAVERWHNNHHLDGRQMEAIQRYQLLHLKVFGGGPRVIANYCPVIVSGGQGTFERWMNSGTNAKLMLLLLDEEVFFRETIRHFSVWQNVVIHDEPAGIAGGLLGYRSLKQAEAAAREVVGAIAYKVADILIDTPVPANFTAMLRDLDAPRRPGSDRQKIAS